MPPEAQSWQQIAADYTSGTGERRSYRLPDGTALLLGTRSAVALHFDGHLGHRGIGGAGSVGDESEPEEVAQGGRAEEAAQVDGDVQVDGPAPVAGGHRGAHGADDRRDEVGGDADSGVFGGGMHGAGR